jgi:hypothetical protein
MNRPNCGRIGEGCRAQLWSLAIQAGTLLLAWLWASCGR